MNVILKQALAEEQKITYVSLIFSPKLEQGKYAEAKLSDVYKITDGLPPYQAWIKEDALKDYPIKLCQNEETKNDPNKLYFGGTIDNTTKGREFTLVVQDSVGDQVELNLSVVLSSKPGFIIKQNLEKKHWIVDSEIPNGLPIIQVENAGEAEFTYDCTNLFAKDEKSYFKSLPGISFNKANGEIQGKLTGIPPSTTTRINGFSAIIGGQVYKDPAKALILPHFYKTPTVKITTAKQISCREQENIVIKMSELFNDLEHPDIIYRYNWDGTAEYTSLSDGTELQIDEENIGLVFEDRKISGKAATLLDNKTLYLQVYIPKTDTNNLSEPKSIGSVQVKFSVIESLFCWQISPDYEGAMIERLSQNIEVVIPKAEIANDEITISLNDINGIINGQEHYRAKLSKTGNLAYSEPVLPENLIFDAEAETLTYKPAAIPATKSEEVSYTITYTSASGNKESVILRIQFFGLYHPIVFDVPTWISDEYSLTGGQNRAEMDPLKITSGGYLDAVYKGYFIYGEQDFDVPVYGMPGRGFFADDRILKTSSKVTIEYDGFNHPRIEEAKFKLIDTKNEIEAISGPIIVGAITEGIEPFDFPEIPGGKVTGDSFSLETDITSKDWAFSLDKDPDYIANWKEHNGEIIFRWDADSARYFITGRYPTEPCPAQQFNVKITVKITGETEMNIDQVLKTAEIQDSLIYLNKIVLPACSAVRTEDFIRESYNLSDNFEPIDNITFTSFAINEDDENYMEYKKYWTDHQGGISMFIEEDKGEKQIRFKYLPPVTNAPLLRIPISGKYKKGDSTTELTINFTIIHSGVTDGIPRWARGIVINEGVAEGEAIITLPINEYFDTSETSIQNLQFSKINYTDNALYKEYWVDYGGKISCRKVPDKPEIEISVLYPLKPVPLTISKVSFGYWTNSTSTQDQIPLEIGKVTNRARTYGIQYEVKERKDDDLKTIPLTRLEDAKGFAKPEPAIPYLKKAGSSPFDRLYPWGCMTIVDSMPGTGAPKWEGVRIPEFWYYIDTDNNGGFKAYIANYDRTKEGYIYSPEFYIASHVAASRENPEDEWKKMKMYVKNPSFYLDYQSYQAVLLLYLVEYACLAPTDIFIPQEIRPMGKLSQFKHFETIDKTKEISDYHTGTYIDGAYLEMKYRNIEGFPLGELELIKNFGIDKYWWYLVDGKTIGGWKGSDSVVYLQRFGIGEKINGQSFVHQFLYPISGSGTSGPYTTPIMITFNDKGQNAYVEIQKDFNHDTNSIVSLKSSNNNTGEQMAYSRPFYRPSTSNKEE